jgi:hypothetical protein
VEEIRNLTKTSQLSVPRGRASLTHWSENYFRLKKYRKLAFKTIFTIRSVSFGVPLALKSEIRNVYIASVAKTAGNKPLVQPGMGVYSRYALTF